MSGMTTTNATTNLGPARKLSASTLTTYRFDSGPVVTQYDRTIRLTGAEIEEWEDKDHVAQHRVHLRGKTLNKDGTPKANQPGATVKGGSHAFSNIDIEREVYSAHHFGRLS